MPPAPPALNQSQYPGYPMPPPAAQFGHAPAIPQYPAAYPPQPSQPVPAAPAPSAGGAITDEQRKVCRLWLTSSSFARSCVPLRAPPDITISFIGGQAMLMQVLSLTPQQIEALPPNERATIQQLVSYRPVQLISPHNFFRCYQC